MVYKEGDGLLTEKFDNLVKQLRVLPGVGQKTAQRMALHLLNGKRPQGSALAQALDIAMHGIIECQQCHSFSDDEVCPICLDPRRDDTVLCVVETAADVMAIEQAAAHFISEAVRRHVGKVTRIAQGIPMGGELEYLDSMTLSQALQNRS